MNFIPTFGQIAWKEWRLQNYYGSTTIHPLAGTVLAGVIVAIFAVPRRFVIPAALVILLYISTAQRLVVGGVDFHFPRILCLVCLLRALTRGELLGVRFAWPDFLVLFYSLMRLVGAFARGQEHMLMAEAGWTFDQFAAYMVGRIYLRDMIAWGTTIRFACLLSIPVAISFLLEQMTGRNIFYIFGGVPEFTLVRAGKMRSQGAFAHAIIAGAFFVSLLPLMMAQWKSDLKKSRGHLVAIAGSAACVVVVICANSSTPYGGLLIVGIGWALFPVRQILGIMGWSFLGLAILAHLVTENGVFHILFTRFSFVAGSTGYHRYLLYDRWLDYFSEWFLIGTNSTAHWGRRLFDVTSEYVGASVRGGILGFTALITIIVIGFRSMSKAIAGAANHPDRYFYYGLGVLLAAHCVMFLGAQYFGSVVFWFWATIGSMVSLGLNARQVTSQSAVRRPAPGRVVSSRRIPVADSEGRRGSNRSGIAGEGI